MKTLLPILLFVTITSYSQMPVDPSTKKYTFQEVVDQPGTKEDLYARAKEWIVLNYRDANRVIQLDDKQEGMLIAKGKSAINLALNTRYIAHTITIEVKDGKYRYTVSDFMVDWGDGVHVEPLETAMKTYQKKLVAQGEIEANDLIKSLKNGMTKEREEW